MDLSIMPAWLNTGICDLQNRIQGKDEAGTELAIREFEKVFVSKIFSSMQQSLQTQKGASAGMKSQEAWVWNMLWEQMAGALAKDDALGLEKKIAQALAPDMQKSGL